MDPRSLVAAIDQGTTSSRCILFDRAGEPVAAHQLTHRQITPRPGWVEHDAEEIWTTTVRAIGEALGAARITATEIAAIGITNQRETTVLWERASGRPVYRAIVWQCRRTAPFCERLKTEGAEPMFRGKTGLVLDPYFSGTKIRWLLDEVPGARARAERGELAFGTVDSWLLWRLTGGAVHATDPSNASRTLCFDIRALRWDEELCRMLGVPLAILPTVRPSAGVFGETAGGELPSGIPVTGIAGDQQAALFGQCCVEAGMAKNTYGTGCFLLLNTGRTPIASERGLLTTVAWQIDGEVSYALEGSVFIGGAVVQWLRDGLGAIATAAESEALATTVADTRGVYLVPAFTGLGAPYWDPYARGVLVGLTRGTTRAHIARAALEAIAYQNRDVLDAMAAESGAPLRALRVDGGAAANNFLCQFQADVLNVEVLRPVVTETTAMGAAFLAGVGAGIWKLDALSSRWRLERRFAPSANPALRVAGYTGWQRAVERARGWAAP